MTISPALQNSSPAPTHDAVNPGTLFILIGPAGAGKNSIMKRVIARLPDSLRQLPTATSRAIRSGEQEGRDHVYLTEDSFKRLIDAGAFVEHQWVHGRLYGILRETLEGALMGGEKVIADIEILGAQVARASYPQNVIAIYIQPPTIHSLWERMQARGDTPAEIAKRMLRIPMELAYASERDYIILNDNLDHASAVLYDIVTGAIPKNPASQMIDPPQFRYRVRVIPFYGEETLVAENTRALESDFSPLIPPAEVALSRVDMPGFAAQDARLITAEQVDTFVPPYALTVSKEGDHEVVLYTYGYEFPARIDAPAGFAWQPGDWRNML